jgi:AcrR family transcriptional regulator
MSPATVFGRQLFEKALRRYAEGGPAWEREALDLPTARAAVKTFLHRTVDAVTGGDHPLGCLIEQAASKCAPENRPVRDFVAAKRTEVLHLMEQRFQRAVSDADPTMTTDPAMLALLTVAIAEGITSRANDGTSPEDLHTMVDVVTEGLFGPPGPLRMPASTT